MKIMYRLFSVLFIIMLSGCSKQLSGDYVFPSKKNKDAYIKSYNESLKLWKTPYREMDVVTSFGTAHVITAGPINGDPLVLLHGTDASSTMWFPNIAELSKTHRIYAIDYPMEAGKSVSNKKRFSNEEALAFYGEVFDHFKMKNISLAGVSRGGWVATSLALHHKERISKLVLLSPAQTFNGMKNTGKVLSALKLKLFPSRRNSNNFFDNFSHHPEKIDRTFQKQLYFAYKYGRSKPGLLRMGKFSEKELNSLKIPVLILVGDHDIVNGTDLFPKAHRLLPNVETALIKDAGHFLSIDQSEVVNKKVVDFLNRKIKAPVEEPAPLTVTVRDN